MRIEGKWPSAELAVLRWLTEQLAADGGPAVTVRTELSAQWSGLTVLVEQTPGRGGAAYDGLASVDVTAFGPDRVAVGELVARIEPRMVELPGRGAVMIDDVEQSRAFGFIPYANPGVRRSVATYVLTSRPQ